MTNDIHAANVANAKRWGLVFLSLAAFGAVLGGVVYYIFEGGFG